MKPRCFSVKRETPGFFMTFFGEWGSLALLLHYIRGELDSDERETVPTAST